MNKRLQFFQINCAIIGFFVFGSGFSHASCMKRTPKVLEFRIKQCTSVHKAVNKKMKEILAWKKMSGSVLKIELQKSRILSAGQDPDILTYRLVDLDKKIETVYSPQECNTFSLDETYRARERFDCCDVFPATSMPCASGTSVMLSPIIKVNPSTTTAATVKHPTYEVLSAFSLFERLKGDPLYSQNYFVELVKGYRSVKSKEKVQKMESALVAKEKEARLGKVDGYELRGLISALVGLDYFERAIKIIDQMKMPKDDPVQWATFEKRAKMIRDRSGEEEEKKYLKRAALNPIKEQSLAAVVYAYVQNNDYDKAIEFSKKMEDSHQKASSLNSVVASLLRNATLSEESKKKEISKITQLDHGGSFELIRYYERRKEWRNAL